MPYGLLSLTPSRSSGPLVFLAARIECPFGYNNYAAQSGAKVARDSSTRKMRNFAWNAKFNREKFKGLLSEKFNKEAHYAATSIPNMEAMLDFIESDPLINDIRWMAYMMATAYWETSHIETVKVTKTDKKGKIITRKKRHWVNMKPIEETGRGEGKRYFLPVKVAELTNGDVFITEQDGEKFIIKPNGTFKKVTRGAEMGVAINTKKEHQDYQNAKGMPLAYFGRGYVQLTWWVNYAKVGCHLGLGFDLLLNPDLALQPELAFVIMSSCMLTGKAFANGKKFSDYFTDDKSDYKGARAMVNGTDHAADIAKIAQLFEEVLYEARA